MDSAPGLEGVPELVDVDIIFELLLVAQPLLARTL
jgi:hypothetical protein